MEYFSTRDKSVSLSAAEAVKMGLSRDGGLLTPKTIPQIDRAFLESLMPMDYAHRAAKVMALYLTDYTEEELLTFGQRAYGPEQFDDPAAAPVRRVTENTYCLELWHGPTSAFKDMALQMLPQLLSGALSGRPSWVYYPNGLKKLKAHDEASQVSYLETLRVYLDNNLSVTRTAAALYLHRSTLLDRLAHITQMLGRDLKDPDFCLTLGILLRAELQQKRLARPKT